MRRLISALALLSAVVAQVVLIAGPANAWYVDVSITGAGRAYETTDAGLLPAGGCISPSTTPTGTLGAACRAGSASGPYNSGWVVRYVAEPAAGYKFRHWVSDGRSNPGPVLCDGANGSSTYTGSACQFSTWENLQVKAVFVDDTAPAMSSLIGPNQPVNGAATFTFSAASDPTFGRFECRVAGVHEWQTCSSGRQENPASSGSYIFEVRAVDHSGNKSAISTWNWTVDKVAPETSLGAGPSGTVASTAASFEFNANEQGTFQCSLDGSGFSSCGSPKNYTGLAQGSHTFAVRAVDVAGNQDASPATRTWTVDTLVPDTTISGGPNGLTNQTTASFAVGATEPGSTFVCRLDGVLRPCGDAITVSDGEHTFTATATDAAGNTDPTPASRTWTVDTVVPATTITSAPAAVTNQSFAGFTFTSDEAGTTYTCTLDDAAVLCTGPYLVGEGAHTFTVAATDPAGNTDATPASHTWTVDTAAPTVESRKPTGRKVSRDAKPSVTFSEAMKETTVEAARRGKPLSFYLTLGGTKVAATVTYTETSAGAFRAVLDPAKRLRARKEYRVVLTTRALDLAGNAVAGTSWKFRTRG